MALTLNQIGGNWESVKTGLKTAKYLSEEVINYKNAVAKKVILPQQDPLYKAGIAEIVMTKHPRLGKEVYIVDQWGEVVSQAWNRSKEGLSNLRNDIKLMLEGKLKYTENSIIRKD